jgi:hypothetical protein
MDALAAWRARDWLPDREVDELNAENQARSASQSPADVEDRALTAHARLVDAIRSIPDAEWEERRQGPTREWSLGGMLGGLTSSPAGPCRHVDAHLPDLEAYVARVARADPGQA